MGMRLLHWLCRVTNQSATVYNMVFTGAFRGKKRAVKKGRGVWTTSAASWRLELPPQHQALRLTRCRCCCCKRDRIERSGGVFKFLVHLSTISRVTFESPLPSPSPAPLPS